MTYPSGLSLAQELRSQFAEHILVMDGATGTGLEALQPTAKDFGGEALFGCNEALNINAPQVVLHLHPELPRCRRGHYRDQTPSTARPLCLLNTALPTARWRLTAARRNWRVKRRMNLQRIAACLWPGLWGRRNKSISITGGVTFDELKLSYRTQAEGLLLGGADYLLLENATGHDYHQSRAHGA